MKRYDTYKDSGVQWLGEIPSHWGILRNKNIFTPHYEAVEKRTDIPLLSLSIDGVKLRDVESGKGKFPKDFEKYNVVYPNQIIFCLFDVDETPRTVGLCANYGMITNAYSTFNIGNAVLPKYIAYYYLAVDDVKALRPLYSGLRKVVQGNRFMQLTIPIPPLVEQEGIVAFLDAKTAEIDGLVEQVERQIELLREYKQTVIARVVTRGLNPSAPLRPSGISWIGDIPQHWQVKRLGSAFTENRTNNSDFAVTEAYKFNYGTLVRKDENVTLTDDIIETYKKYTVIKPNDILINGLNLNYDFVSQRVAISHNEGIITSAYLAITPREDVNPLYYCYLLKSMDTKKMFHGMGTGIRLTLSFAELKKQFILFPPLDEQQEIVDYIDRKTTEIDRLVVELTYQVEYLKEYKQRLIADVVTGKINVQPN